MSNSSHGYLKSPTEQVLKNQDSVGSENCLVESVKVSRVTFYRFGVEFEEVSRADYAYRH